MKKLSSLVLEQWAQILPAEDDEARLSSWKDPAFVPKLGFVATINVMHKESYENSSAEIVVLPIAQFDDVNAALDEFANKIKKSAAKGVSKLLKKPLEEWCKKQSIPIASYVEGMFDADESTIARRNAALAWTNERFPAVAERMKEVYGLRLPQYMATLAAFFRSLDEFELRGMDHLGRRPGGIMVWFEETGLSRKTRDNLDPRLECRFRADPPELVTILWGDSDGLHYGLWYDDPADPPTCIAHNYARDSAETWRDSQSTPLGVLLEQAKERIRNEYGDETVPLAVHAAAAALEWFVPADMEALAKDPPAKRWLKAPRIPTLGTFGPALPKDAGTIRVGNPEQRHEAWKKTPARVRKWIESAKRDCAEGKPAAALTFGLDLHWMDSDEYRNDARELLLMAYEKLGRHAHAETLKVHYAHRDLGSVGVFLSEYEATEE